MEAETEVLAEVVHRQAISASDATEPATGKYFLEFDPGKWDTKAGSKHANAIDAEIFSD